VVCGWFKPPPLNPATNHTHSTMLYSHTAPFLIGLKLASGDAIGHQDEPIGKAYLAHEAEVLHFGLEVSHVRDLRTVLTVVGGRGTERRRKWKKTLSKDAGIEEEEGDRGMAQDQTESRERKYCQHAVNNINVAS